jgi:hypothetical protein
MYEIVSSTSTPSTRSISALRRLWKAGRLTTCVGPAGGGGVARMGTAPLLGNGACNSPRHGVARRGRQHWRRRRDAVPGLRRTRVAALAGGLLRPTQG